MTAVIESEKQNETGVRRKHVELTDEQQAAVQGTVDWYAETSEPILTLGGYAGTGKTTTIRSILARPEMRTTPVAVAAFTGKAASVLIQKGMPNASTLHSLMYRPVEDMKGKVQFEKKESIGAGFVVIDEGSMINKRLLDDLMSYRVRALFVGDMGQLEPIGDNPNLMHDPDLKLTTIHRQAEKSPIVMFAHQLRMDAPKSEWRKYEDGVHLVIGGYDDFVKAAFEVEQCICGYNRTRVDFNSAIREHKGFDDLLCVGDRIICLRNNHRLGVFNGLMAEVLEIKDDNRTAMKVTVRDALDRVLTDVTIEKEQFGKADATGINDRAARGVSQGLTFWDYGYCVTAHKSQGSEWRSVAVLEELHPKWEAPRWRYTSATRPEQHLTYCY